MQLAGLYTVVCLAGRLFEISTDYTEDISPQNVLTEAEDDVSFRDVEEIESQDPSIPITSDGTLIYESRATMEELSGIPVLTDFGQMRLTPVNKDWWMSDLYRTPEVLLGLPWGFPVDVWSVGLMVSKKQRISDLLNPTQRSL